MQDPESLRCEREALLRLEGSGGLRVPLFIDGVFQPEGFKLHGVLERLVIDGRARRILSSGGQLDAAYDYRPVRPAAAPPKGSAKAGGALQAASLQAAE
jgi:hypothetical protein